MRKKLLCLLPLLAVASEDGCDPSHKAVVRNDSEVAVEISDGYNNKATLQIVEHKGHRFAVLVSGSGKGICEVTEASRINKE